MESAEGFRYLARLYVADVLLNHAGFGEITAVGRDVNWILFDRNADVEARLLETKRKPANAGE